MKENIWTKRLLFPSASAAVSLLVVAGVALASTDASNTNTGADSSNEASVSIQNNVTINSTNNATISNNIAVNANTGYNSASQNTGGGFITTGDINGSVSIKNTGNENVVSDSTVSLCCSGSQNFSSSNENTGADSHNKADVDIKNDVEVNVNNNSEVENNVGADLNTGGNEADKNTGIGSIKTGDINFDISIVNDLNKNIIGGPLPGQPGPGPNPPMPSIPPAKPGQVLAAQAGLPITGGSLPLWPILVIMAGIALKATEKTFKIRFVK